MANPIKKQVVVSDKIKTFEQNLIKFDKKQKELMKKVANLGQKIKEVKNKAQ